MKKILGILFFTCLLLILLPQSGLPAFAATTYYVGDYGYLKYVINTLASDGDTIEIQEPILVDTMLSIQKSLTFTATGDGKLIRGMTNGPLFMVYDSRITVTCQNITLDGNNFDGLCTAIIVYSGALEFNSGTKLINCKNAYFGGGVKIEKNGKFTMNTGSSITNNTADKGGGVFVNEGTFIMNGGSVTNNTADKGGGGIYSYGTFTMTGGNIADNVSKAEGGGVLICDNVSFNMSGGKITGNTATSIGGGVKFGSSCTVNLSGDAQIFNNHRSGNVDDNLYCQSASSTPSLTGTLASTAIIGVTADVTPTSGSPFTVAVGGAGYTISSDDAAKFASDNASYHTGYDSTNKKVLLGTLPVDVAISEEPQTVTYNGSAQAFAITGTPNTGFAITYNGSVDTPTNAGTYDVVITRPADIGYNLYSKTITGGLTINQNTPTIDAPPTAASITYGAALSTSVLSGGSPSVPGAFSWTNGSTIPTAGTNSYSVIFTPSDNVNYKTVTTDVTITVNPANVAINEAAQTVTYNGSAQAFGITGTPSTGFTITYKQGSSTVTPTNAGTYDVEISRVADTGYKVYSKVISGGLTINKDTPTINTPPTAEEIIAGETLSTSTLSYGSASVLGTFSWTNGSTIPALGTNSYSVTFTPNDTDNYKTVTTNVTITVKSVVAINEAKQTFTYNGSPKAFAITGTPSTGFTTTYKQGSSTVTPTNAGTYDVEISRAADTGYKAYSKVISGGLTINKDTPTIITPPTAAGIIYGAALSTSTLSYGSASVLGTFSWTNGSTIPAVGTNSYSVTFTPNDTDNYNTVTTTVAITVPTAPAIDVIPSQPSLYAGVDLNSVLTKPTVLDNGFLIQKQGWQSSVDGSTGWQDVPGGSICTAGMNGYYIRYYVYYKPSGSGTLTMLYSPNTKQITINRFTATLTLTVSPASLQNLGTAVTLNAAISGSSLVLKSQGYLNTVPVTFKDGTTTLGTKIITAASGDATFSTSALSLGNHTLTAEFPGESDYYAPATSSVVNYTIQVDPDIATVTSAKTAAQSASYSNMTQETATSDAVIVSALKATADTAVNNSSVTTTINQISYTLPVAGTSADPNGTDGSYSFTVTLAKGVQTQTTIQKTISITATAFTGITDVQAVAAAKIAAENAIYSNMTQAVAISETAIKDALKATAATAVSGSGVTITINKLHYLEPSAGILANPSGTSGSYTFTITVSKGSQSQTTIQMSIAIAPTIYTGGSSGGNDSNPAPAPGQGGKGKSEGTVEKDQQKSEGAPAASVNNSSAELKVSILTPQEQKMLAQGENVRVILKVVDISASISTEEKQLIDETLNLTTSNTSIPALYVDLSLYKQVGDREQSRITETNSKISVSIEVPKSLWNTDVENTRSFYIIRIHENEVIRIDGTYDSATHLFTFETDRFSTYALTYQDVKTSTVNNGNNTTDQLALSQNFYLLHLTAKAGMYAQTLTYAKISDADGYLIYGAKCGQKLVKLDDVDKTITSYTMKNLKLATYYKYQVKAYKMINGKRVIIRTSKIVHSITKSKIYANATKLTSNTTEVKLSAGQSKTVTCQVVLPEGKKQKEHTAVIRYESSNKAIATVNSKGKITAKAKGTCYVYVYAQNGVYKKIKVTVE